MLDMRRVAAVCLRRTENPLLLEVSIIDPSLNINDLIIPFYLHVVEHLHHNVLLGIDSLILVFL